MIYIYESHLDGGFFITHRELSDGELYCEECCDSDRLVCVAEDWADAAIFFRSQLDIFRLGGYDKEYLTDMFNQCCRELGGENVEYQVNK